MRDFYERRLLDLVEKQKNPKGYTKLGKMPVFGKPPPKEEEPEDKPKEEQKEETEEKPNIALRIINLSKGLLDDYFENPKFIEGLKAHSSENKIQLNLLNELGELCLQLQQEAVLTQVTSSSLTKIRALLSRIGELLTLKGCAITSYEFKQSNLLWALELLLTKSPSQAKIEIERKRLHDTGEEMKRTEEMEFSEMQKQSKKIS